MISYLTLSRETFFFSLRENGYSNGVPQRNTKAFHPLRITVQVRMEDARAQKGRVFPLNLRHKSIETQRLVSFHPKSDRDSSFPRAQVPSGTETVLIYTLPRGFSATDAHVTANADIGVTRKRIAPDPAQYQVRLLVDPLTCANSAAFSHAVGSSIYDAWLAQFGENRYCSTGRLSHSSPPLPGSKPYGLKSSGELGQVVDPRCCASRV